MIQLLAGVVVSLVAVIKCEEKGRFDGTRVKFINSTTEIAVMTFQQDMNYVIMYHTTTRPCSECDK